MPVHCTATHQRVRCYGHQEVVLSFSRYLRNGRHCLRLISVQDGAETGTCAVCTVNLPHIPMRGDEVAIKTWYENVGMLGWLIDQGIVSHPLHYAYLANVFIPVCALLIQDDRLPAEDDSSFNHH